MKVPRRLIEDREVFARLVAEDERIGPRSEAMHGVLKTLDAMSAEGAVPPARMTSNAWKWLVLIGAGFVLLVPAFRYTSLSARTERAEPRLNATPAIASTGLAPAGVLSERSSDNIATERPPSVAVGDLPDVVSPLPPSRARPHGERDESTRDAASVAVPVSDLSLRREVELIIAARQALTRGDAQQCLSSVALYSREFPAGQFALEGKMMRIEATAIAGDRLRATALAREFVTTVPGSPYEARLRSLLADWEGQ